jgi:hypothetical protein
MRTYEIILAREEIRTITLHIEAEDQEEAEEKAHDILMDTDFHGGRHVHGDQWVQEVNPT